MAYNRARSCAGFWKLKHQNALEREKKLKQRIAELEAKVKLREHQLFGKRAEKQTKKANDALSGKDKPKERNRGQQPGQNGHGRRPHHNLPKQDKEVDLPGSEKQCDRCGLPFEAMPGTEDSEVVVVEVKAHRRVYRRKLYQPTCSCNEQPAIITAPVPPKLFEKGAYDVSFWAHILVDKFVLHTPTSRTLFALLLNTGLDVSQGTVTDGLKRLLPLFEPLYDAIVAQCLTEEHWHADETRWQVFEHLEGKTSQRWYLWVFHSRSAVVFILDPSRSADVPKSFFGDDAQGILNVDRYVAYKSLLLSTNLILQFCWAHVRRDFIAVAKGCSDHEDWTLAWLESIAALYQMNDQRIALLDNPEAFAKADSKLREATDKMKEKRDSELLDETLHPARRKVLESLENHWFGLLVFVDFPHVPMDNNTAERDVRGPAVGRKNYYGSGAIWSGKLAAIMFALFQTLLLWNINPHSWLTAYLQWCADTGGEALDEGKSYLPWNMSEEQRHSFQLREPKGQDTS